MKSTLMVLLLLAPCSSSLFPQRIHPGTRVRDSLKADRTAYLGEEPPGMVVRLFSPGTISTSDYEHGSPSFSPDGKEAYWSVRLRNIIGREVIMFMKTQKEEWTLPQVASFSDTTLGDLYPTFSLDGKKIYFTSDRSLKKDEKPKNRNVWIVERDGNDWTEPAVAGFDSLDTYGISVTKDGTLYFMAQQSDKSGSYDLYRAKTVNGRFTEPEKLNEPISTQDYEDNPFIAPDESFLIFESNRPGGMGSIDLYISFRAANDSWSAPVSLGTIINSSSAERFPIISPNGKYFFFGSNRTGNFDVYWVDIKALSGVMPK